MNSPLRLVLLRPFILLLFSLPVMAADPVVSNISAVQRAGTQLVDITYNVAADYPLSVALQISSDAGATFTVPATTTSGAIGTGVTAGLGKLITWNAGTDYGGRVSTTMRFKVTATDVIPPAVPAGFSLIPAGSFTMGDALDGNQWGDAPKHTVNVSAFYMAQNLVTKAEWDAVRTWGLANGYTDLVAGAGKASNHPVQSITWYQMVKWCNARSQQAGFVPVYYTDDAQTTVYKTGNVNVTNAQVKWITNGFRLSTEAEWEKAARGGLSIKRFPWGDTISQSQANYYASISPSYSYDLSREVNGYHPSYTSGGYPYTSPVGSFAANGYGLYDMAGNVMQWCWDWYGSYDPAVLTDPRGPAASGSYRVNRGGSWTDRASSCRVAERFSYYNPSYSGNVSIGLRVARSSVQ